MRERVGREDRVVEDHRLGLAVHDRRTANTFQNWLGSVLGSCSRSRASHWRAWSWCPRRWWAIARNTQSSGLLAPPRSLDGFLELADRLLEPAGPVERRRERVQDVGLVDWAGSRTATSASRMGA